MYSRHSHVRWPAAYLLVPIRPELQVVAVLRTARPVVQICSSVATVDHRGENVMRVQDGFDEDQCVVRSAESVLEVPHSLDDERSRRGVATEHFRQLGVGPVRNVIVRLIFAQIASFDRVSAVVDEKDDGLEVVPENCRQLLRRDLERAVAYEQNMTAFRRCGECAEQRSDRVAYRTPIDGPDERAFRRKLQAEQSV